MTVAEILTESLTQCGSRTDITDARLLYFYNRGQKLINRLVNLDCMWTEYDAATVADSFSISIPSDVKTLVRVKLEDGTSSRYMRRMSPRWFDERWPKIDAWSVTGRPAWYTRRSPSATTIEIWPGADSVYTVNLEYYKWFADVTDSSDTTVFDGLEDAIVEAVKYGIWNAVGQLDRAAQSLVTLQSLLNTVKQSERDDADMRYVPEGYSPSRVTAVAPTYLNPWVDSQ